MSYDTRARWDHWHRRTDRAVRRHLRAASPRALLPGQLPPTDEERAAHLEAADAYDLAEAWVADRAAEERRAVTERWQDREHREANERALAVALAGGDGLGPPPDPAVVAEFARRMGRAA